MFSALYYERFPAWELAGRKIAAALFYFESRAAS
jgi:hypothetical protein